MAVKPTTKVPAQSSRALQVVTQMVALRKSLRARRISGGISQEALAAGLKVTRETVNRRETGNVLDLKLVDALAWIVRLGGEVTVTWRVTPADAKAASEWGRVAYPDYDLDGEVLPIVARRFDTRLGMNLVVLEHEGRRHAIPAHHVLPADPPPGMGTPSGRTP